MLCEVNSYNGNQKQSQLKLKCSTKSGKEENDDLPGRFEELELEF